MTPEDLEKLEAACQEYARDLRLFELELERIDLELSRLEAEDQNL